jgi:hypothetical protein
MEGPIDDDDMARPGHIILLLGPHNNIIYLLHIYYCLVDHTDLTRTNLPVLFICLGALLDESTNQHTRLQQRATYGWDLI